MNSGRVVTRERIQQHVWGCVYDADVHALHVHITNLRKKIEPEPARPRDPRTEARRWLSLRRDAVSNHPAEPDPVAPRREAAPRGLTPRAILIALVLIVLTCWWVAASEIRTGTTEITCTSLPIGVVFILFCLCLANLLVARAWPRGALTGSSWQRSTC